MMRHMPGLIFVAAALLPTTLILSINLLDSWRHVHFFAGKPDVYAPFSDTAGKREVPCPSQTEKTAVIFAFGQSNAGNYLGERRSAAHPGVLNFFRGRCYAAADPMLGASGSRGSVWPLVGDALMASGKFDAVVFVTVAVGGSDARSWQIGGANVRFTDALEQVGRRYRVTHFLWHQGESDWGYMPDQYAASLRQIIGAALKASPGARFWVSVATVCRNAPDRAIQAAQKSMVDGRRVLLGPDTDQLGPGERYDGCHLSASGQEKAAALWARAVAGG